MDEATFVAVTIAGSYGRVLPPFGLAAASECERTLNQQHLHRTLRSSVSLTLSLLWLLVASPVPAQGLPADLAPLPTTVPAPQDNPTTPAKVELGKLLFFDPRLSGDNQMSCATCHLPDKAFADGLALSPGVGGKKLTRNTQSCLNVAFYDSLFWDGRVDSLEAQALVPIDSVTEMNQDLDDLEAELGTVARYVTDFKEVFGTKPNRDGIAKALAAFQRTLVTGPSPLDRYLAGDRKALSTDAKRGLELFEGEAGCIECHNGPLLSDGKFYRLGVSHRDRGRELFSQKKDDRYRFRTPSLRNIAQTGPYMHDGSLQSLNDVVTFYFRGIPDSSRDGLSLDAAALSAQSFSDIAPIVEFLKALSGEIPKIDPPELP